MKKLTLSVVIPAYNEEKNIRSLLQSLSIQNENNFILREIVVLSDGSTDMTESIVKTEKKGNRKIKLYSGRRVGKSRKISSYLLRCLSDVVVMLDADVAVKDKRLLNKVAKSFSRNSNIGLIGLCDVPQRPHGFIEGTINEAICVWNGVKEKINNGNSIHNIHGCAYAMSKKLYRKIDIPKYIFNDDEYAYLLNHNLGMEFVHLCTAKVYYEAPKSIMDFTLQSSRFSSSREKTIRYFGDDSLVFFAVPPLIKYKEILNHFIFHNFYFASATFLQIYYKIKRVGYKENFGKGYWTVIESTKLPSVVRFFM